MNKKRVVVFLIILLFLVVLAVYYPYLTGKATIGSVGYDKEPAFVNRVIDGDTVVVSGPVIGNNTHIRLLGVNTPEINQPYDIEAASFLKSEIEGKNVELLRDMADRDMYGRSLRYIFYDNRLINVEILENGFAVTLMTSGLKYENKLVAAEKYARENNLRLWKKSSELCSECIKLSELDYKNEFFIIENDCSFDCDLRGWFVKDDSNHFFYLDKLNSLESKRYNSSVAKDSSGGLAFKNGKTASVWNDDGDRFFMRDKEGGLVILYEYGSFAGK